MGTIEISSSLERRLSLKDEWSIPKPADMLVTEFPEKNKILLVDDDQIHLGIVKRNLCNVSSDLDITTVTSGRQALEMLRENNFDCIVSDLRMPEMDGLELFEKFKELQIETPFIFFTSLVGIESALKALEMGAFDYIFKFGEFNMFEKLLHSINDAIKPI